MYLWRVQQQTIAEDKTLMLSIYKSLKPGQSNVVESSMFMPYSDESRNGSTFVQKSIYRLSVLGVVTDWTVADWSTGIYRVDVRDCSLEDIRHHLKEYVRKYEPEFEFEASLQQTDGIDPLEQIVLVLLQWVYEHFAYNRRQSIKNVYELCSSFKNSEEFKKELERIFTFTETTYAFDEIAENPHDFNRWFSVFGMNSQDGELQPITEDRLRDIRGGLTRFLESYQFNTGLNLISGLARLMLGEFDNSDGQPRMESALKAIAQLEASEAFEIYSMILAIGMQMGSEERDLLGDVLLLHFPQYVSIAYDRLQDNASLLCILGGANDRLSKLKEAIYGGFEEA